LPTQDITLNLKNRAKAITSAAYGPENPKLPNEAFWRKKADQWDVSMDDAKQSLCGNCAAFNVSDNIKECIAQGIGMEADPWGTIKLADLGYCEIFDFKCAASRTCDAWVVGGPNTGEQEGEESEDYEEGERIAAGSKEKMRKPGAKGAPSAADFKAAAKTAKPVKKK
jgi:hypothetical protein